MKLPLHQQLFLRACLAIAFLFLTSSIPASAQGFYGNYDRNKAGKPQVDIYEGGGLLGMFIVDKTDTRGNPTEITIQLPSGARPLLTDSSALALGAEVSNAINSGKENGDENDSLTKRVYQLVKKTKRAREAAR